MSRRAADGVSQPRVVAVDGTMERWRTAARALLLDGISPDAVQWNSADDAQEALELGSTIAAEPAPHATASRAPTVPRAFLELAEQVACHRDPERWALLYRVLWRLTHGERHLLDVVVDPDVHRLGAMAKAVRRDVHKMHAFVRFRRVPEPDGDGERFVAWFEPEHRIVERATPFFARRFPAMRWSILTPECSAHWDGTELTFGDGVPRSAAPGGDDLEELWRTYYANVFNPARLKLRAMRAEMPKRYWRDLPEAALIEPLARDAPSRVRAMIAREIVDEAHRERKRRAEELRRRLRESGRRR